MEYEKAKEIIESEFGDLETEDKSQFDTLVSLLERYGFEEEELGDLNYHELTINGLKEQIKNQNKFIYLILTKLTENGQFKMKDSAIETIPNEATIIIEKNHREKYTLISAALS